MSQLDFRLVGLLTALGLGLAVSGHAQADSLPTPLPVEVLPISAAPASAPLVVIPTDTATSVQPVAPPDVKVQSSRALVVAITALESRGVTTDEACMIGDNLAVQLQQSGKFRVMERSQIDQILKEQNFQASGACDGGQCAVEMGRLLGIERMVVGSIGHLGASFLLNLRLVDVGTGEAVRTSAQNRKGNIDDVLLEMIPNAVADLSGTPRPVREPTPVVTVVPPAPKPAVQPIAVAPAPIPAPAPVVPPKEAPREEIKGSAWPWVIGGLAVAGGGAAAVILMTKSSATPVSAPASSVVPVADEDFKITW